MAPYYISGHGSIDFDAMNKPTLCYATVSGAAPTVRWSVWHQSDTAEAKRHMAALMGRGPQDCVHSSASAASALRAVRSLGYTHMLNESGALRSCVSGPPVGGKPKYKHEFAQNMTQDGARGELDYATNTPGNMTATDRVALLCSAYIKLAESANISRNDKRTRSDRAWDGESLGEDDEFSLALDRLYPQPCHGMPVIQTFQDFQRDRDKQDLGDHHNGLSFLQIQDRIRQQSYEIFVSYADIVHAVEDFLCDDAKPIIEIFTSILISIGQDTLDHVNLFSEHTCEQTALAMVDAAVLYKDTLDPVMLAKLQTAMREWLEAQSNHIKHVSLRNNAQVDLDNAKRQGNGGPDKIKQLQEAFDIASLEYNLADKDEQEKQRIYLKLCDEISPTELDKYQRWAK